MCASSAGAASRSTSIATGASSYQGGDLSAGADASIDTDAGGVPGADTGIGADGALPDFVQAAEAATAAIHHVNLTTPRPRRIICTSGPESTRGVRRRATAPPLPTCPPSA